MGEVESRRIVAAINMNKDTLTSTRNALIKDTSDFKRDAGQIVEDVKKHASSHVEAVKTKASDLFDLARGFPGPQSRI
jgi:hypothetical protein